MECVCFSCALKNHLTLLIGPEAENTEVTFESALCVYVCCFSVCEHPELNTRVLRRFRFNL